MGSRAVVVICRDQETVRRRFGVTQNELGICYTRTGRRFFSNPVLECEFLARIAGAIESSGLWESLNTSWPALDCELMPWSAKAQELLAQQYAPAGAAGRAALPHAIALLRQTKDRQPQVATLLDSYEKRAIMVSQYVDAYRHYCWPVQSLLDLKLAPFHLLASEGAVHSNKDHLWHMEQAAKLATAEPQLILATPYRTVELNNDASEQEAIVWWEKLTRVAKGWWSSL